MLNIVLKFAETEKFLHNYESGLKYSIVGRIGWVQWTRLGKKYLTIIGRILNLINSEYVCCLSRGETIDCNESVEFS